ncbi:hypothetical protein [Methylibium sp.]|uniref:hypothetical protein n=1 Tax=Methylibium sp. TaxID=2067992 RepID=UPI00286A4585|nr:hypothetical protein [Methylibium sp.]
MQEPARYLVLIESDGAMLARLFDAGHRPLVEFDAASEEVAVMTRGLVATEDADAPVWQRTLAGHSQAERVAARVYLLDM